MWKTIYIAHTEEQAKKIKQMLTENGFLVQLKSAGGKHNMKSVCRFRRQRMPMRFCVRISFSTEEAQS